LISEIEQEPHSSDEVCYACGHTLVDQLTTERIERGEGIFHLFE
jgi:hypothetical protein